MRALRSCDIQITDFNSAPAPAPADVLLPTDLPKAPQAKVIAQADLGDYAERLMGLILKSNDGSERITIPGADDAITNKAENTTSEKFSLARYGTRLVLGVNQEQPPSPYTISTDEADMVFVMDYQKFLTSMANQTQDQEQKTILASMQKLNQLLVPVTWDLTILPEGIRERFSQQSARPELIPIDRSLFARLPRAIRSAGTRTKTSWRTTRVSAAARTSRWRASCAI
jgi:hypothetical protein